jgi:ribonuclease HII
MPPSFAPEDQFLPRITAGFDEAGRGPLAGPVVAACVYVPPALRSHPVWRSVNDSKKLSAPARETAFAILTKLIPYGVGVVSTAEIDELNILQATFEAMRRAAYSLQDNFALNIEHGLLDGNRVPKDFPCPTSFLIKGDSLSSSIAAASIIAKVTRDNMMCELAQLYPVYGFDKHAGYGTPAHLESLKKYGHCAEHRTSFEPIKSAIQKIEPSKVA